MLTLLAATLYAKGATALRDYEPPSVTLAEQLAAQPEPQSRQAEVLAFLAQTGE